jgi:tetratricopeptide (TPR) repeat protein
MEYQYYKISKDFFKAGTEKMIQQDFESAIIHFTIAIEFQSNYGQAFLFRGISKMQIGDNKGCLYDCNKAIYIYPNYAQAYYNRGIAKLALKEKDSGCIDLIMAQRLGYEPANEMVEKYCK